MKVDVVGLCREKKIEGGKAVILSAAKNLREISRDPSLRSG
jgi:hypothetical protein